MCYNAVLFTLFLSNGTKMNALKSLTFLCLFLAVAALPRPKCTKWSRAFGCRVCTEISSLIIFLT